MRELYLNNPDSEFRVADDIEVKSEHCQTRTIDILLEVKQTRTCIKKVKVLYKELLLTNEVPSRLMEVVNTMIEDWQELVKYHRKRTLTSMLNYDQALCQKLKQGKHTYRIILETQFPDLVRVKDDGINDNEIAVPRAKVTVKEEPLTTKDTHVTIDSETHHESMVQLTSLSTRYYHETTLTLKKVRECTQQLQEMFDVMSSTIK